MSKDFLVMEGGNPMKILEGPFTEFSSGWYKKVGTLIVATMILEIPIIHVFPINETTFFGCMRWYDRKWSCSNKRISRKTIQVEYEDLYEGTVFDLDYRLA